MLQFKSNSIWGEKSTKQAADSRPERLREYYWLITEVGMLGEKNENHGLTFITSSFNCSSQSFFLLKHHLHMFSFIILRQVLLPSWPFPPPPPFSLKWVFNFQLPTDLNQKVPHVCRILYCYCIIAGLLHSDENKWHRMVQAQKEAAEHRSSVLFHFSVVTDVLPDRNSTPSSNNVIMWQQRWIWDNKSQFDANWAFSREIRII